MLTFFGDWVQEYGGGADTTCVLYNVRGFIIQLAFRGLEFA